MSLPYFLYGHAEFYW